MNRVRILILVAVAVVVCASLAVTDDGEQTEEIDRPPHVEPRAGVTYPERQLEAIGQITFRAHLEDVGAWQQRANQVWWHDTYLPAVHVELDARRAAEQAAALERTRESYTPAPSSGVGGSCVLPAYICERESGGDYNAVNPTGCGGAGCYGRFQFDPRTWTGAGCAGHPGSASPAEQDACATKVWDGGAGAGHWGY